MAKSNPIQIGIDLGTTNSAVVVNHNDKYEIVKNSDQMDYTPSVFGYNKGKNLQVGKKAYENLFQFATDDEVKNYKAEVKRLMGTKETIYFERVNQEMSAEEVSAEILKYLKEAVLRKYPDINTDGVVITVPAYFSTTQKESTKEAGELAGFKHVVLIQEPIAGAIAYGFDNKLNENWLVYDLGGGTFDVAVISSKDGVLTVKGHDGDNYLGGKDFDNLIVNKIIVPSLQKKCTFDEVSPDSNKTLHNKLKYYAETAKKELTDSEETTIVIDNIKDDDREEVYLELTFTREEFENLIAKEINKSIKLCEKAISESGLTNKDIHKIILIGGPTQIPYIRQKLQSDLGIAVDSSVDPLTVVAKGACIFGASQLIPKGEQTEKKSGTTANITLNYEPVVSDTDALITGVVKGIDMDEEHYIQIQSEDGKYSSNKIKLKNGKFVDTVLISEGKSNVYYLYLTDNQGNIIETDLDSFVITHGVSIAGTPLSHSIGVVLNKKRFLGTVEEETMDKVFERGMILPLEKTLVYHTSRELKKGDADNALPIRISEGESKKPDRNQLICEVILKGQDIPYSLPEGTTVELTVKMDVSGTCSLSAYFPDIDFLIEKVGRTKGDEKIDSKQLKEDILKEKKRLNEMGDLLPEEDKKKLFSTINELSEQVESKDEDTKRKTNSKLKSLKAEMDTYEDSTESTRLIEDFHQAIKDVEKMSQDLGGADLIKDQLEALKKEGKEVISTQDWERLGAIVDEIRALQSRIIFNTPEGLKAMLGSLYQERNESSDPVRANHIFNRASQYIATNDMEGMRQCIQDLLELMPKSVQANLDGIAGISK